MSPCSPLGLDQLKFVKRHGEIFRITRYDGKTYVCTMLNNAVTRFMPPEIGIQFEPVGMWANVSWTEKGKEKS